MLCGPIKRLWQWAWLGLLLLPLAALVANSTDLAGSPDQVEPAQTPFTVTLQKQITDDQVHYNLVVHADPSQVDLANTTVVAHSRNSAGFSTVRTLSLAAADHWHWRLSPDEPARYRIDLEASGRSPEGEPLRMTLGSHYFQFPEPGDPYTSPEDRALAALEQGLEEELEPVPTPELAPLKAIDESPEPTSDTVSMPPSHNATDAVNRVMRYGSILTACLVALALLALGYQTVLNRRRARRSLVKDESENATPSAAPPPMQDIGSDDNGDLDTDDSVAEPPAELDSTAEPETVQPPDVALDEARDDGPLFPLDDEDWASAELADSVTAEASGPSSTLSSNPSNTASKTPGPAGDQ